MQTHFAHPAIWRGLSLLVGPLVGRLASGRETGAVRSDRGDLVSWCAGARSRREDELARMRQEEQG